MTAQVDARARGNERFKAAAHDAAHEAYTEALNASASASAAASAGGRALSAGFDGARGLDQTRPLSARPRLRASLIARRRLSGDLQYFSLPAPARPLRRALSPIETSTSSTREPIASLPATSPTNHNHNHITTAACLCNRAAASHAAGRMLDALADCGRALACNPAHGKSLSRRAQVSLEIRDAAHAVRDLESLVALTTSRAYVEGTLEGIQVRSSHWSPYDPNGVVNADP